MVILCIANVEKIYEEKTYVKKKYIKILKKRYKKRNI